jgi:hypothetical protein
MLAQSKRDARGRRAGRVSAAKAGRDIYQAGAVRHRVATSKNRRTDDPLFTATIALTLTEFDQLSDRAQEAGKGIGDLLQEIVAQALENRPVHQAMALSPGARA